MIEQVEYFRTEVQAHVFPWELELLDQGEVRVGETRAVYRGTVGITQLARCCKSEGARIKPCSGNANFVGGQAALRDENLAAWVGIGSDNSGDGRNRDLIRTVLAVAVILEVHTALVEGVDQEHRKA